MTDGVPRSAGDKFGVKPMSAPAPQWFEWNGLAMIPLYPKHADRVYVVHERYRLEHREDRSEKSHAHEFAWLREAWKNLPEKLADLYPTPDHLRRRALIEAGWYTENAVDCGSNAAALRVAALVPTLDSFAHVIVRGPIALVRRAKSQSYRAMNMQEFAASKAAIIEVVASMIGVPAETLQREAGKAA